MACKKTTKEGLLYKVLPKVISPYLQELIANTGGEKGPIGRQFIANPKIELRNCHSDVSDPLLEDEFLVAPRLVYKYRGKVNEDGSIAYYGRVLWTITLFCTAYCRFCTRGREVGRPFTKGKSLLLDAEITKVFAYLKKHPEINEVILSGGDPFVVPMEYLTKIITGLSKLQKDGFLDIVRIGTRAPITNPRLFKDWHFKLVKHIKNPYLMVHINHPAELTNEALTVLDKFRTESQAAVMSQTVLLKGVNDSVKTLLELFNKMAAHGIRPYYLYQNDPVWWATHFTVRIGKAIKLWQELRPKLSGIAATARFVIDTPFGSGKIPVPEGGAWRVDYRQFCDFKKQKHLLK